VLSYFFCFFQVGQSCKGIGIGDVINGRILPHIIKFDKKTEHAFVIPDIEDYLSNSTICIMLFPNLLHYWCHRQEVLFLDNEISFNEAIIEEREQGIQEIQSQIGEVNEIFKDLAVLVHEQGAMIGNLVFPLPVLLITHILVLYF